MTDQVTTKGKTVADAISEALLQLGARKNEVNITVIDEPKEGVFGFLGRRSAKVEVTKKRRSSRRQSNSRRRPKKTEHKPKQDLKPRAAAKKKAPAKEPEPKTQPAKNGHNRAPVTVSRLKRWPLLKQSSRQMFLRQHSFNKICLKN